MLGFSLLPSCEKPLDQQKIDEAMIQANLRAETSEFRMVPFKATFFTLRNYEDEGIGFCTEDPYLTFNHQRGEGNGTFIGKFTTTMSFCGSGFDYKNGEGKIVASDGDELHFMVPSPGEVGHVIPYGHPLYEFQFQDPITFTGGTGRFEGATGSAMTNSFVDLFDDEGNFIPEHRTDHVWTGTLILKNGK